MPRYSHLFSQTYKYCDEPHSDLLALWGLRALIYLKGHQSFIAQRGYSDDDILNLIGLSDLSDICDINRKQAKKLLFNRLSRLESKKIVNTKDVLSENIEWLSKTLSLTKVEILILQYAIMVSIISELEDAMNTVSNINKSQFPNSLATILGISGESCKSALNNNSTLINSGLLKIDNESRKFGEKLTALDGLADTLLTEPADKKNILNNFFKESPKSQLTLDDFQ